MKETPVQQEARLAREAALARVRDAEAAEAAEAVRVAAAATKRNPGRPRKVRVLTAVTTPPPLPSTAGDLGKKRTRRNWFHPFLVQQILAAVRSHGGSASAAVNWLQLQWPVLYRGLGESTVRTWFAGKELTPATRESVARGCGFYRPSVSGRAPRLLGYVAVEDEMCTLLAALRAGGACFSIPVARRVIMSVLEERAPALLASNGGPFQVSESWVRAWLYKKLKWVHRRVTADSQHLPLNYKQMILQMNQRMAVQVMGYRIPKGLLYSADESFQELVSAATDTFDVEGSKRVKGIGSEDKRGITIMITLKPTGDIAPVMLIYGGTTQLATPGGKPKSAKSLA